MASMKKDFGTAAACFVLGGLSLISADNRFKDAELAANEGLSGSVDLMAYPLIVFGLINWGLALYSIFGKKEE